MNLHTMIPEGTKKGVDTSMTIIHTAKKFEGDPKNTSYGRIFHNNFEHSGITV